MRYIKLDLSFWDRLKVLFFGIVPENKLPEVVRIVETLEQCPTEKRVQEPQPQVKESINNSEEEEFHVPFFELQDDDVKSNF